MCMLELVADYRVILIAHTTNESNLHSGIKFKSKFRIETERTHSLQLMKNDDLKRAENETNSFC